MNELKITLNDKEVLKINTPDNTVSFDDKDGNKLLEFNFNEACFTKWSMEASE